MCMKNAILVFETGQLEMLAGFLKDAQHDDGHCVVALGADVEFLLEKQAVPFLSARSLRRTGHKEILSLAQRVMCGMCEDPLIDFFEYRGISIAKIYTLAFQSYVATFLYYADIIASLFEDHPDLIKITVLPPSGIRALDASSPFPALKVGIVAAAAQLISKQRGAEFLAIEHVPTRRRFHAVIYRSLFLLKRRLFEGALFFINYFVISAQRPKKIRILASDYWGNLSGFLAHLPDGEMVLLDRMESLNAGLGSILRHRMRFMHVESYVTADVRATAAARAAGFMSSWKRAQGKSKTLAQSSFRGYALGPVLNEVFSGIVSIGGPHAVAYIEGAYQMFDRLQPDIVIVRASVSAQPHFSIVCMVARLHGIPSLEVQHGLF